MTVTARDHPVIVPTSLGPVGGIVTEPAGAVRAAMLLLQGGSRGGRAGINAVWTDIARRLAGLGVAVLRVDYAGDGESYMVARDRGGVRWKVETDSRLVLESAAWFRERVDTRELFVAGSCYGGRLAIAVAAAEPSTTQLFLVVPYLRSAKEEERLTWRDRLTRVKRGESPAAGDGARVEPEVHQAFAGLAERASTWILLGDKDPPEAFELQQHQSPGSASIEIDVVPSMALYPVHYPDVQAEVRSRLVARVEQALG